MTNGHDTQGHPYCDEHKFNQSRYERTEADLKEINEKIDTTCAAVIQRIDDVDGRAVQRVDASDRDNSLKHGDIYKIMREMEKSKMTGKTFWSVLTILVVLSIAFFGGAIGYTNKQINDTRIDQITATENHAVAMENFTYKLGGKLDVLKDDSRDIKAEIKIVQNSLEHNKKELDEHKKEHPRKVWDKP